MSLWSSSTGFTGIICTLRIGKYVILLLIWNLHFESLHLQLTSPKGKCLCTWLLTNVEKICTLGYKKSKTSLHTLAANADPAPLLTIQT